MSDDRAREPADQPARPDDGPRVARETGRRLLRLGIRLGVCILVAGFIAAPLAFERGVEHTEVHDAIGVVPATFTLTGNAESELRLGVLGNLFSPASNGPIGISATVDGPPSTPPGSAGVASYFSPQMLEVYGGLFHDPGKAIRGYTDALADELTQQVILAEVGYAVLGGAALLVVWLLLNPSIKKLLSDRKVASIAIIVPVALVITTGIGGYKFTHWTSQETVPEAVYNLPSLDGTMAAGTTTDSIVLRLAIEGALPKVKTLISRQESQTTEYVDTASSSLMSQHDLMAGPRDHETAIMMQSDMHCNSSMIKLQHQVVDRLNKDYGAGTVSLLAISGDLTTNGTAAEGGCIEQEAAVDAGAPVAAVTGNHESEVSADQMKKAGMSVLDDKTVDVGGTKVLGAGDPSRSEMFGDTRLRGEDTEETVGERVFHTAEDSRPQITLLHEGYAVQAFIGGGVEDMTAFLDQRGSNTVFWDDGVRDLPTSAIFYGHWHRSIEPRVVWNSDGSWTLVMELNTSGGAIASPTLNHFSTPWSQPQQTAAFPVVFKDTDSGLVTGYQLYTFGTDGSVVVAPRVDIGTPDGQRAHPSQINPARGPASAGPSGTSE